MNNRVIINILRFVGLLFLQVLVIDDIRLGYYIHPYVYVLFVFLLPFNIPNWQLLLSGFFMGLAVDLFNGTPGLNAAATVFMAFVRPFVINAMTRRKDINENDEPSLENMGVGRFLVYSLLLLLAHNLLLFTLEVFSFYNLEFVIIKSYALGTRNILLI